MTEQINNPTDSVIEVFTQKELEAHLGVTTMTVYLWRKQAVNPLPWIASATEGGRPKNLYPITEVMTWVQANKPELYERVVTRDARIEATGCGANSPDAQGVAA